MNKITILDKSSSLDSIPMNKIKQGEIAMIVDSNYSDYNGSVVRRVNSKNFLVENLSKPSEGGCWSGDPTMRVKLLPNAEIHVIINK